MLEAKPAVRFLILWHVLVAGLLVVMADLRGVGRAFWGFRREELLASFVLIGAYVLVALLSIAAAARGRPFRLTTLVAATLSIFGLAFLTLLLLAPQPPYSRALIISLVIIALALMPAAALIRRLPRWLPVALALYLAAAAAVDLYRTFGPEQTPAMSRAVTSVATALYPVEIETYRDPVPKSVVRGGAISVAGDRYLLATGDGRLYLFAWPAGGQLSKPQLLPYRVPFNPEQFKLASHAHWDASLANSEQADAIKGVQVWQFRVADVLVREHDGHPQIFTSHHYWKDQDKCFTVRVSLLELDRETLLAGAPAGPWKTVYEASPCLPLEGPDSLHGNNPFAGMEVGGRMMLIGPDELLLTLGDHAFAGAESPRNLAQDPMVPYGKTIQINLKDGSHEIFTSGHRNPQGLFPDSSGIIWETEHGPQGGDELNILTKGRNYGWPLVTYGTDYGSTAWPLNKHQGHHDGFMTPVYAWVPSIGVSNLVRLQGTAFPNWKDDLLVTSLHARTIYRLRLEGRTVVYSEPISVGDRIRDIVEGPDGQILMWTDSYNLASLHPAKSATGAILFGLRCGGCHTLTSGASQAYGPDLTGIVGRRAGIDASFDGYSPAMKAFGKTWTADRLDMFLRNPQGLVPGTLMNFPGVPDPNERSALVQFLVKPD
jgi:cytochrome c2